MIFTAHSDVRLFFAYRFGEVIGLAPHGADSPYRDLPTPSLADSNKRTSSTLTPRHEKGLRFIFEYIERNQVGPTWAEIAKHIGSASKNPDLLVQLTKRGLIYRLPIATRNIRVTVAGRRWYRQNTKQLALFQR